MAEKDAVFKSYLTCQVCCDTLKDPVSLGCYHNFCLSCLQDFWSQAKNKNCPICKRKSSKDATFVNFRLQKLVNTYAGRQRVHSKGVCMIHTQDLKWCKEKQRAVCPVCEVHDVHDHTLVPLEDEVHHLKEKLLSDLKSLKKKVKTKQEIDETYDNMIQHRKKQLVKTKYQIKAEFDLLHQFLVQEKKDRLAALIEEDELKGMKINQERKINKEEISSLSGVISTLEQTLAEKDNAAFLINYKCIQTSARDLCSSSGPQLIPGGLIDVAKHLGNLSYRVWENMRMEKIKFSPVILDPNTAQNCLVLSNDLTGVRNESGRQQYPPDIPERFTAYSNCLGSEGFSSGKHRWEVEVGDHPHWLIGVAKESVDRKDKICPSPEEGMWCLIHYQGGYTTGYGKRLDVNGTPKRISVQLNCQKNEVTSYDPEGTNHIYTYDYTPSETIYPFFSVGPAGEAETTEVKVCDVKK